MTGMEWAALSFLFAGLAAGLLGLASLSKKKVHGA